MDTSLINLIPNLTRALHSIKIPRNAFDDPPPPNSLAQDPSPQRKASTRNSDVPFQVKNPGTVNLETTDKLSPNQSRRTETSLINLIPNLVKAFRFRTFRRSASIDPPPSSTLAPSPSPQPQPSEKSRIVNIPLTLKTLGSACEVTGKRPVTSSNDNPIALGPSTTYTEFLGILGRKLSDVSFSKESRDWRTEIAVEIRRRKVWQFREWIVDVERRDWGWVL
jgi:hypothetical protein